MRCLSEERLDSIIGGVRKPIELFVSEAKIVRSVDGYLIAVGLLLSRLRDLYPSEQESREVLRKVLGCDEVREALRPLARYVNVVEFKLRTDPRHRSLAKYVDLLIATLSGLEPSYKELEVVRPPMIYIESSEAGRESGRRAPPLVIEERYREKPTRRLASRRSRMRRIPVKKVAAVAISLTVVLLLVGSISSGINLPIPPSLQRISRAVLLFLLGAREVDLGNLSYIRESIYGSTPPSSVQEAVLKLWDWSSSNFRHVDELDPFSIEYMMYRSLDIDPLGISSVKLCDGGVCYKSIPPGELLSAKVGRCIDHAVFTVATLLSVNISPTYVILINEVKHAVAGFIAGGILYVVEQRIPPIEYADYVEYVLGFQPKNLTVFELWVEEGRILYRKVELPKVAAESYLEDGPPLDIAYEVASKVGARLGLQVSPYVKYIPRVKLSFTPYVVPLDNQQPVVPATKLYAPLFREVWVEYLARRLLDSILRLEGSYSYLWVEVEGGGLEVYLA